MAHGQQPPWITPTARRGDRWVPTRQRTSGTLARHKQQLRAVATDYSKLTRRYEATLPHRLDPGVLRGYRIRTRP
jgi:hypothetical protein